MGKFDEYVADIIAATRDAQKVAELICRYNTLLNLVEEMRKAQKVLDSAPRETRIDLENVEILFLEAQELEKKVDRLIQNIRIDEKI